MSDEIKPARNMLGYYYVDMIALRQSLTLQAFLQQFASGIDTALHQSLQRQGQVRQEVGGS